MDTTDLSATELQHLIRELEKQTQSMSDQIWNLSHQVLEMKAREQKNTAGAPSEQHTNYLRSILVKILCSKDDVRGSIMPVLSSLVHFSDEDLKEVYGSNPNWVWIKKKLQECGGGWLFATLNVEGGLRQTTHDAQKGEIVLRIREEK